MIFKNRKVTHLNGDVELKLSLRFSQSELKGIESISEDPHVSTNLRIEGDQAQRVDYYLCYLRVLAHMADIWENAPPEIIELNRGRKAYRDSARKPRKRRKRK